MSELIKCPYCPCFFVNRYDLGIHLKAFGRHPHNPRKRESDSLLREELDYLGWKPSSYDDCEWCPARANLSLKRMIEQRGKVEIGGYRYSLSGNRKWLKRRKK